MHIGPIAIFLLSVVLVVSADDPVTILPEPIDILLGSDGGNIWRENRVAVDGA